MPTATVGTTTVVAALLTPKPLPRGFEKKPVAFTAAHMLCAVVNSCVQDAAEVAVRACLWVTAGAHGKV